MKIAKPLSIIQHRFNELCDLKGGPAGGPARTRVQELLHEWGVKLNAIGQDEINQSLNALSDRNPWHVCFAVGVCWGHLAKFDLTFVEAAVNLLEQWNDNDLKVARAFHYERGPEPIEGALSGGNIMFSKVLLPEKLPQSLEQYQRAQERWMSPVLSPERPSYIGSWNGTAMFMVALFSMPALADQLITPKVMLPPGGPIFNGLMILHQAKFLPRRPAGSELDDQAFEPGAIYENNQQFVEIHTGHSGWNLLTVHSGLYLLGTRYPGTDSWFN